MKTDYCIFILSHGRPNNIKTYKTLKDDGHKDFSNVYIVCDNEDETVEEYKKKYKDKVVVFDKKEIAQTFDTGDLSNDRRTIVYARNACFQIAKDLGFRYFIEFDDDYTSFQYRYPKNKKLMCKEVKNIDNVIDLFMNFLKNTSTTTIAMSQGGDFIGGAARTQVKKVFNNGLLRKAMNSFCCDVYKPFQFVGRINEDVNTYVTLGQRGKLLFTYPWISLVQVQTQKNKGGMSDVYIDKGTYLKSFYSVMYAPSCVKIGIMQSNHKRIHHKIEWNNCTPMILNERYRKNG